MWVEVSHVSANSEYSAGIVCQSVIYAYQQTDVKCQNVCYHQKVVIQCQCQN